MATVTNNAARAIHLGGVLLKPGVTTPDVPDEALKSKIATLLLKDGSIVVGEAPEADPKEVAEAATTPAQPAKPEGKKVAAAS